jgi:catechol 2,3-dioxygenase-like lactoylglutathione lyase family enzyme
VISTEVGIVTADAVGLSGFYVDALGFRVVHDLLFPEGRVVRLEREAAALKLYEPAAAPSSRHVEPWFAESGFAYAALHVDNVDREVEAVRAHGGRILAEVRSHRPGARFALVADPAGNVWEILEES